MLCARNLVCELDGRRLLHDIQLELAAGETLALLGPNGAGKSTLLRTLSGELPATSGTVELNGRPMQAWSGIELARQRAVLPQSSALRFPFEVRQVVALGRHPWGSDGSGEHERSIVEAAMHAAAVTPLAHRRYTHLSAGERARVQFARVLAQVWEAQASGPRYLFLDEPTASLDLAHQHELLAMTRRFAAAGNGVAVILHDPNLAMLYSDRALLLKDGRAIASGPTREVLGTAQIGAAFDIEVELLEREGSDLPWIAARPRSASDAVR